MQDATIENNDVKQEQKQEPGMYQDGKYPSIIDTDDMVFKLGLQLVQSMNKEKLLDALVKQKTDMEQFVKQAAQIKEEAEKKLVELQTSNDLYEKNNFELGNTLVLVRKELEEAQAEVEEKVKEHEEALRAKEEKHDEALANKKAVYKASLEEMKESHALEVVKFRDEIVKVKKAKKK